MRLNGDNTELSLGKELPTTFDHFHESVYLLFIAMSLDTIIVAVLHIRKHRDINRQQENGSLLFRTSHSGSRTCVNLGQTTSLKG